MRKFTKLTLLSGLAALTAITSATARQKSSKAQTQDVEWIDGEQDEEDVYSAGPLYDVGDTVVVVNPFTYDYEIVDIDGETPLYYEIKAVSFQESKQPGASTFRYQINGENDWYAEAWLDFAPHPHMCMSMTDEVDVTLARLESEERRESDTMSEEERDLTTKLSELERKLLDQQLDELTRDFTIDLCLDHITHGTAEQKAEAERLLAELTEVPEVAREKSEGEAE